MPRPLEPLSKKQVKYYEEEIKTADLQDNKKEVRRLKRLFLCYIKKRDLDISFFKNHKIYKYFNKPKRIDLLNKELKKIKTEDKTQRIKNFIDFLDIFEPKLKGIVKQFISDGTFYKIMRDHAKYTRLYYNPENDYDKYEKDELETMWKVKIIYDWYKKYNKQSTREKEEIIKSKIKYLEHKKEYMRKYREPLKRLDIKSINTDDKNIDKLKKEIEKMLEEYNKKETEFKRFEKRHDNKMKKMERQINVLIALKEEKINVSVP